MVDGLRTRRQRAHFARRLRHDRRGSVHVLEVMLVSLLIAGAMVAVSALQAPAPDNASHLRHAGAAAEDLLGAYAALPATNTSARYSNLLEQLIVEHLAGKDTLARLLDAQGFAEPRLYVEMDGRIRSIAGPTERHASGAFDGSAYWPSVMGGTLLSPVMSVYNGTMPVAFEVLPLAMHRQPLAPGVPYVVHAAMTPNGGASFTKEAHLAARIPTADQAGLRIDPVDPSLDVQHGFTEPEVNTGTGYKWDVRFRLTGLPPVERNWLDTGARFLLERPPGWDLTLEDPGNWTRLSAAHEPTWRLDYGGGPHRGAGAAWLNFTLERPHSAGIRHEHVALREEAPGWSEASIILTPTTATPDVPPRIIVSQPGPYPLDAPTTVAITITNPDAVAASVDALELRFLSHAHQFKHVPADWSRALVGAGVTYTYTGGAITVPASGSVTVPFAMHVEKPDGENLAAARRPVVEYLGPGALEPPNATGALSPLAGGGVAWSAAVPADAPGLHVAVIQDHAFAAGLHTVRVGGDTQTALPQGVGRFRVTDVAPGMLTDVLATRHTMAMELEPRLARQGQEIEGAVRTGTLSDLLSLPGVGEEVRLRVTASDLIGALGGRVDHDSGDSVQLAADFLADPTFTVPALPDLMPGPLVITVEVTVTLTDHGDVTLRLIGTAFRTSAGIDLNPAFLTAHLQYRVPGVPAP